MFQKKLFVFASAISLALISNSAFCQAPNPEEYRREERLKMLQLLNAGAPQFTVEIDGLSEASPEQQALIKFYQNQIRPIQQKLSSLGFEYVWYSVALDRALYESETEKESWIAQKDKIETESSQISNGDALKLTIKEWARLAEGQNGFLADEARRAWKDIEIAAFDEKHAALLKEKIELNTKTQLAANESPFTNNLSDVATQIGAIRQDFEAKKISLEKAVEAVEAQRARGEEGQSRDIAAKVKTEMNRVAAINSFLAKSKGYRSWADYQIAVQAAPYDARFNSVEGRIAFLEDALKQTDSLLESLLQQMIKSQTGLRREDLREAHMSLLAPDADGFGKFYPIEKVDELWAKTVLSQGFSQADIDHINRDVFPRDKKYTHAYMNSLNNRVPKRVLLKAGSLDMVLPPSDDKEAWYPANIYIIQNFYADAMDSPRVAFHEGGHGLQFTKEDNPFGFPQAYGYVEIHSITQEQFFMDKEFVKATAQTREGVKPTEAEIDDYMRNVKIQEFLTFRIILARALFELKLWDFDYENSSENWTDRAVQLWGEIISKGTGLNGTQGHGVDQTGRGPFNGPHFRDGSIQYIGYSQATVSAYLSAVELHRRLKEKTGRETFLNQPTMAKELTDGYYRSGFENKFPLSVEKFTGQTYSVKPYVDFLADGILEHHAAVASSCQQALPAAARSLPAPTRPPEVQP